MTARYIRRELACYKIWTLYTTRQKQMSINNWLTPLSRVLLEKLTVTQLVKKFPTFYGTRRFITVFTRTRQWSLSWARCNQTTISHPISRRPILILSSYLYLRLPSGLFFPVYPTKFLYGFLISPMRATCSAYIILLGLITNNMWWSVQFMKMIINDYCTFTNLF
jgi:hypothetical protein